MEKSSRTTLHYVIQNDDARDLVLPPWVQTVTSTALPESWQYQSDFRTLSHDNSKPNCIIRWNVAVMPIHHKSRLLNHANCSYKKVIPHMQCAFQAASQQLDTWLLWNSLRSKIEGSYFDSWPLLDFFKMWNVPGFRSAGHIILLFNFCLPYIQENPEVVAENVLLHTS